MSAACESHCDTCSRCFTTAADQAIYCRVSDYDSDYRCVSNPTDLRFRAKDEECGQGGGSVWQHDPLDAETAAIVDEIGLRSPKGKAA